MGIGIFATQPSVHAPASIEQPVTRVHADDAATIAERARVRRDALGLHTRIVALDELLAAGRIRSAGAALTSTNPLTLDVSTHTTLRSIEPLNTDTTDFSPTAPSWAGVSTAAPTLAGRYDGIAGDGHLTFRVTQPGQHGLTTAEIDVSHSATGFMEQVIVAGSDPLDEIYSLSNGLTVSFGSGLFSLNDTFEVTLQTGIDKVPDTAAAFDGSSGAVGLEFDQSVTAGSFIVNGETIAVAANDSIASVLDRITASAADVTASYDAENEQVVLTRNTAGDGASITVSNDTSGFLAAMKLSGASPEAGSPAHIERPLTEVAAFASVQAGSYFVNGIELMLDPTAQSVLDVIDTINHSGVGAIAELVRNQYFKLTSTSDQRVLTVDSGTTGLFEALGMAAQASAAPRRALSNVFVQKVTEATGRVFDAMNGLLGAKVDQPALDSVAALRADTGAALEEALETLDALGIEHGLALDEETGAAHFSDQDGRSYGLALRARFVDMREIFGGLHGSPHDGLLGRIVTSLNETVLAGAGSLVDTFV